MTTAAKPGSAKINRTSRKAAGVIDMASAKCAARAGRFVLYAFGSAVLKAPARSAEGARNIGLGQAAMKKIGSQLVTPGVKLRASKTTPLFRADPANPRQLIRVLGGHEDRGVFENGVFKVRP